VEVWEAELASPDRYMLGTIDVSDGWYGGPFWVFIMDRHGRYVWYHEVPDSRCSLFAQISHDGTHILFDGTTNYVWDDDVRPTITRLSLDLEYHDEQILDDLGFTFDEIEGGALLYEKEVGNQALLELLHADGSTETIWSCTDWLHSSWDCAANSVVWVEATDTVLWSMYNTDTVAEVDRQTGELIRYFGQIAGSWDFDPPDAVVDYQHYPSYTPDGTLIVSTHIVGNHSEQRAREFRVDDDAETMTEIWSYGQEVPHYASYGGEAFRLQNGNTLICYGTDGAIREVTHDKKSAWDVVWPEDPDTHLLGHNTLLDDLYAINLGPGEE